LEKSTIEAIDSHVAEANETINGVDRWHGYRRRQY
jgi:hypothetical protein